MGQLSEKTERLIAFTQQAERYRDAADEDYITARVAYQNDLPCAFLTSAHQAIEKYLKAILLFNQLSTKEFSHDLKALLRKIESEIGFVLADVPETYLKFVSEYLSVYGFNRYLDAPLAFGLWGRQPPEMLALDWSVWYFRRFAKNLFYLYACGRKLTGSERREIEQQSYEFEIAYLRSEELKNRPHSYKIANGFLEKVVSDTAYKEARASLIWKNPCYGAVSRKRLKNYPINSRFIAGREQLIGFEKVAGEIKGSWSRRGKQ